MNDSGWSVPFDSSLAGRPRASLIGVAEIFRSEADAVTFGYESTVAKVLTLTEEYEQSLSESDQERLAFDSFGDGSQSEEATLPNGTVVSRSLDGCTAEADIAIYGSVSDTIRVQEFVNEINAQTLPLLDQVEGVIAELNVPYSECMARGGVDVDGLEAGEIAESSFGRYRRPGDPPQQAEIDLATVDFRCQEEAGYRLKLDELFLVRNGGWIIENEGRILGIRDVLNASLTRAQAIIAD